MPLFFSFVCHFNWYWKLQFQSVIIVYIRIQLLGGIKSIISIIKLRRDVHKVFFNSLFCLLILIRAQKYLTKPLEKKKKLVWAFVYFRNGSKFERTKVFIRRIILLCIIILTSSTLAFGIYALWAMKITILSDFASCWIFLIVVMWVQVICIMYILESLKCDTDLHFELWSRIWICLN